MRVKQNDNVLELFERFACPHNPMTLIAIASVLVAPKSSALDVVETLAWRLHPKLEA